MQHHTAIRLKALDENTEEISSEKEVLPACLVKPSHRELGDKREDVELFFFTR